MNRLLKRACAFMLVFAIMLVPGVISFANERTVTVFVDGNQLTFDVNPVIEEGRTLVPMRLIFEALGAKVDWIDETKTAVAEKGDIKIEISVNSKNMQRNGETIELDVPARLISSRTLVPVRAISESFGCEVGWNEELYRVTVASNPKNTASLTADELAELNASYKDLRYYYEQEILPQLIFGAADYIADCSKNKNPDALSYIKGGWELVYASAISSVRGETPSAFSSSGEVEKFVEKYSGAIKSGGFSPENYFDVTYEATPAGKTVILISFKDASSDGESGIQCKYIVITAEGKVRYFTAETSGLLSEDSYMLCEVTSEGRNNYGVCGIEKQGLFAGIDKVLFAE